MNHKINKLKYVIIAVFCLYSIASIGQITSVAPVVVQKENSLVIPDQGISLSFDLSSIPRTAIIKSNRLQLTLSDDISHKMILDVKTSDSRFGFIYVDTSFKKDKELVIEGHTDFWDKPSDTTMSRTISLKLMAGSDKLENHIYVLGKGNQSPRLVITYELPPNQPVAWAMPYADARHSGHTFMRFGGDSLAVFKPEMISQFNAIQKDLVIYKDKVIIIDNENNKTSLYTVDPITKSKRRIIKEGMVASTIPVIDPFGNLYYSSANSIEVVNLDNFTTQKTPIKIDGLENITAFPTIGPDGSFYLIVNTPAQDGTSIYAYSPYPVHALLWEKSFKGKTSSVTLNKEGTIAYVASYGEQKLIAINTMNGKIMKESAVISLEYENNMGSTTPLVTNNGFVFVTNKLMESNKMFVFDSDFKLKETIDGKNISRAVSGSDNKVFFIKDGLLHEYFPNIQIPFVSASLKVRSLVADLSNNIYCLGMDNKLYTYYGNGKNKAVAISDPSKDAVQKAMVMSRDGVLYAATSKELISYKFIPAKDYTLSKGDDQKNDIAFRGKSLTVPNGYNLEMEKLLVGLNQVQFLENVIVSSGANVEVISGKTISFKRGFRVKSGAKLTCKIGY